MISKTFQSMTEKKQVQS